MTYVILKRVFTVRWPDSLSALSISGQMGSLGSVWLEGLSISEHFKDMSPDWGSMCINRQRMGLLLLNVMRGRSPVLRLTWTHFPWWGPVLEALLVNEERLCCIRRQRGCPWPCIPISDAPQNLHWSICLTYQAANEQFPLREDRNRLRNHLYIFCTNWSGNNLWGSYNCSLS